MAAAKKKKTGKKKTTSSKKKVTTAKKKSVAKKKKTSSKKKPAKKRVVRKKRTIEPPVEPLQLEERQPDETELPEVVQSQPELPHYSVEEQQELMAVTEVEEKYMTVGEHLEELRQVFIRGLLALSLFMIFGMVFGEQIHEILTTPYRKALGNEEAKFFQIKLLAPFMIYLKSAFMLALLLSFPLQLYFLWGFVAPALDKATAKYGKYVILFSTLLFWLGVGLCWYGVYEKMLHFFLVTWQPPDMNPGLPIDEYFDIFFNLHLLFGLAFQLPIAMILLGRLGVLKSKFLFAKWREVTITLAISSAFFSPPDIISLLLLFLPLELLFFISLLIMRITEKKD